MTRIDKLSAVLVFLALPSISYSADFGTTGLIDIPSARMMNDGELNFTMSRQTIADIYSLNYQATPWFETTFRYTIFNPDRVRGSSDDLYDRSYEIKLRLLEERDVLPQVSLGIRDLLGTGAWGSEYLVASKRFGNFDFTLGAGWGRLAERSIGENPLTSLSDNFASRDAETGRGGKVNTGDFFSGQNVGLFGGFTYDLSRFNTRLIVEYNSDSYRRERRFGTIDEASAVSYGVEWEPTKGITLGLSRQQGNQVAFSIAAVTDTKSLLAPKPRNLSIPLLTGDNLEADQGLDSWYSRLLFDLQGQGLLLWSGDISENGSTVTLEISNMQYNMTADALERFLTLAEVYVPPDVNTMEVIINEGGLRAATMVYNRRLGNFRTPWLQGEDRIGIQPAKRIDNPDFITGYRIPNIQFGADLAARVQLFDPDNPARYQVMLRTTAVADLGYNITLNGSIGWDIDNDFDTITRESNSVLPHVRSDVARYLKEGDTGLEHLYVEKRGHLGRETYYRAYTGYLEEMYFGGGTEVLYAPFASRLAFGFNLNWVRKRAYDKRFDLLDYSTVTGHVSAYWATPWYNYDVAVHAGRYLAEDWGATFEVRRTFDNGWMVGAFATLTDVPFDVFGEGSFDKGLFFRVPLDQILPGNTRASYATQIRSIQRDGGQRIDFATRLWQDLRPVRYDALDRNRTRMLP